VSDTLYTLRVDVDALLSRLSGRVRAPVLDAALAVHRALHTLAIRLQDHGGDPGPLDLPGRPGGQQGKGKLMDDERNDISSDIRALPDRIARLETRLAAEHHRGVVGAARKARRAAERLAKVFKESA